VVQNLKNSIILISGGMDSTTLLYEYKEHIAIGVSFNYGSKHNYREIPFARLHCQKLGIEHRIINLDFTFLKSHLLKNQPNIPDGHYNDDVMKQTIVPFRNAIMLSYCVALAESDNYQKVYIANHNGDHVIYPDCREDFINAFKLASAYGTNNKIQIVAPYVKLTKRDIFVRGYGIVNYDETYSCYKGEEKQCGTCGTCVERLEAMG